MDPRQFNRFVNHWCPKGFHHEDLSNRIMRAFMAATSCVEAQRETMAGKTPIAPLSMFPEKTYPEGGIGL